MKEELESRVKRIIGEQLLVSKDELTPEASYYDLGADSLDMVEMVMEFEDEFRIEIPDEDVQGLETVRDSIEYLKNRLEE